MSNIQDFEAAGYRWDDSLLPCSGNYLLPEVSRIIRDLKCPSFRASSRIFDLGCGNGSVDFELSKMGWDITGVDAAEAGIARARAAYPHLSLHVGSAYDNLAERYGQFPVVLSLEVVEHLYYPRRWATSLFSLTEPGGYAIVSTPYHGYLKNLLLAATGKLDAHFTALWDDGHIKFWSKRTLGILLQDAGFSVCGFFRIGRIAPFAKSMIFVCYRHH